jgi:Flp pilus assembly protein TadB
MLSQDERRQLALLEQQVRQEDPAFEARMAGRDEPRQPPLVSTLACALIWAVAAVLVLVGWWAVAIVVGVWATVVSAAVTYHRRTAPHPL